MTPSTLRLFHGGVHRNACSYVLHELPTTDLDVLSAYHYFHGREIDEGFQLIMTEKLKVTGIVRSHFLDSGSFTLWTRAAKYAKEHGCGKWDFYDTPEFWKYMQDYVDFIKKYKIGIDLYANVDVIPNAELSWRNLKWLEKQGLRPVPVVHYRTPIKELARHIDAGYDLIGLGGLVGSTRQEECRRWLEACFDLVCDTPDRLPKVRIHGFGVTSYDLMLRFPWWSVDSTSWTKIAAYGGIIVPGTRSGEFVFNDPEPKRRPYVVTVSDEIPKKDLNKPKRAGLRPSGEEQVPARDIGREYHFRGLSPYRKECVLRWLDSIGVPFGKNDPKTGEVIEYGVCNRHTERRAANLFFFEAMKKAIPEYPWPYIPKHPVPQEFQVQRKKGLLP